MGYYWTCPRGHLSTFADDEDAWCYRCDASQEEFERAFDAWADGQTALD